MREPVSFVVSSYNNYQLIANCVSQIKGITESDDEIIIVDDGSDKDIADRIVRLNNIQTNIFVLFNSRGSGPGLSKCRKKGRELAKRDWVLFLDNDVDFRFGDPISDLQNYWNSVDNFGAIQPKRVNRNGSEYGANFFDRKLNYVGTDLSEPIAFGMYPEGAFWLTHRETFGKWNFNESLTSFEDSDIGFQMHFSGLKVASYNSYKIYHEQWGSGLWSYAENNPESRNNVIESWRKRADLFFSAFGR